MTASDFSDPYYSEGKRSKQKDQFDFNYCNVLLMFISRLSSSKSNFNSI